MNLPRINDGLSECVVLINRQRFLGFFVCLFVFLTCLQEERDLAGKEEFERRGRSQFKQ